MAWLRLTIETTAEHVDPLTDLLERFAAISISYTPLTAESIFGGVGTDPALWQRTSVSALLDGAVDMDILLACIRNRIGTEHIQRHSIEPLAEQQWTEVHKQGQEPKRFGDRLLICPSWIRPTGDQSDAIILDPGLAFGSGAHETTTLCLEWLADQDLEHKQLIDYGCGSGILALAAARLGAERIYAVDIDPQALSATRDNARNNALEDSLVIQSPGQADLPPVDILIANILLNPLLELAPEFSGYVRAGGQIVLSGLLANQVQDCLDTYARWFKMEASIFCNEWALVYGCRYGSEPGI